MGLLDDAKNLADQAVDAVGGEKANEVVDQATDQVDSATGGASSVITDKVDEAAGGVIDGLANN
jgi:hypothetical protein